MKLKTFFIKYIWAFLLIIAGVGVLLDLIVIRYGVGASGDAVWYMQGAENILKGYGYGIMRGDGFIPTTMYPPFYSIFLAGFGWFGISLFTMAGVLSALLLGANIFLTGWIVYKVSGSAVASSLASIFALMQFDLFELHTWAMSEPLYITLTLISLLSIFYYRKNRQLIFLALAGLTAGLSVITRYVGISLAPALCLWILVWDKGTLKKRIMDAAMLGSLCLLPVALFFIRNASLTNTITGRSALVFHAIPKENYANTVQTLLSWVFTWLATYHIPWALEKVLFIGLLLLSAVLFYFSVRHSSTTENDGQQLFTHFEYLLLIFLSLYVFTFMGSIYLSLAGSPTNWISTQIPRYLTSLFPVFLILAVLIFLRIQSAVSIRSKVLGTALTSISLAILALYIANFSFFYSKGIYLGYTGIRNKFPALVAELRSIDPARPVIASNYELVTFLAGRPVYSMPGEGDELTAIANPNLPQLLEKISDLLDQGAILVVYRSTPDDTFYYDPMLNGLTLLHTYGSGWPNISLYTKPGQEPVGPTK